MRISAEFILWAILLLGALNSQPCEIYVEAEQH